MGYFFLTMAIFADVTKGFAGKKVSKFIKTESDAMLSTMLRMPICVIIGLFLLILQGQADDLKISGTAVILPLILSGVSTSASLATWLICARTTAYMTINVFMMISTIIPTMLCALFFGETIGLNKIIGFAVLLAGIVIMCIYDSKRRTDGEKGNLPMLLLCTLMTGLADFSQKWFVYENTAINKNVFNIYTYVISAVILYAAYRYFRSKEIQKNGNAERTMEIKSVLTFIIIMAVCLYINTLGKLSAASYLDAASVYPVEKSLGMILGIAMSHFLLKEKMTVISIIGCLVSFAGLMIMNVL